MRSRYPVPSRPSSRPLVSSWRGVFFIISSSHLTRRLAISSALPNLVSFLVSDDSGARGVSSRSPSPASFRIASSHQMRASKTTGRRFRLVVLSRGVLLSRRNPVSVSFVVSGISCRRASRLVSSRAVPCVSSDEGQASKTTGLGGLGFVSLFCPVIRSGRVIPGSRSVLRVVVIASSPSSPASKQGDKRKRGQGHERMA